VAVHCPGPGGAALPLTVSTSGADGGLRTGVGSGGLPPGPASDLSTESSNAGYPDFPPSPDSWLGDGGGGGAPSSGVAVAAVGSGPAPPSGPPTHY